jgi:predicted DsbA family dithiol-disulfide isomerase
MCAGDQGEFWRFYDEMFSGYVRRNLTDDDIVTAAGKLGLDSTRFRACLTRKTHAAAVERQRAGAKKEGVELTPSVVIGGRLYVGTQRTDTLRDLVLVELRPGILEALEL